MLLPVLWVPDQSTGNRMKTKYPYILLCTCLDMVEMRMCLTGNNVHFKKEAALFLIWSSVKHKERSWFLNFDVLCKLECWYLKANCKIQLEIPHLEKNKATHMQKPSKIGSILYRSCYGSMWLQYCSKIVLIYPISEIRNYTFSKMSYVYFVIVS